MSSRRLLKAAEAIREVVASSILTELRDPRIQDVTVLRVEVSPDMREAKVAVSVMGSDTQQQLAVRGLQNAAGFLQSKIANRIDTRYTPRLQFVLDKGAKNAFIVAELLAKIRREQQTDPDEEQENVDELEPGMESHANPSALENPLVADDLSGANDLSGADDPSGADGARGNGPS